MKINKKQQEKLLQEMMRGDEELGLYDMNITHDDQERYIVKTNYPDLISKVELWAGEKGILTKATPLKQAEKTQEELNELFEALVMDNNSMEIFKNSKGKVVNTQEEIKDALGDILVTIIIQAKMNNLNLLDCLEGAYNVISKRSGRMVDGKFQKNDS